MRISWKLIVDLSSRRVPENRSGHHTGSQSTEEATCVLYNQPCVGAKGSVDTALTSSESRASNVPRTSPQTPLLKGPTTLFTTALRSKPPAWGALGPHQTTAATSSGQRSETFVQWMPTG